MNTFNTDTKLEHENSQFNPPVGVMRVEAFNYAGELVDTYEDSNLVMNHARDSMQFLQGGVTASMQPINTLRLGNKGTNTNHGDPKKPGTLTGEYHPDMNQLFQNTEGGIEYICTFNVQGVADKTFQSTSEKIVNNQNAQSDSTSSGTTMKRVVQGRVITFIFEIPREQGNIPPQMNTGSGYMEYSEAALYCGNRIFSMKTFPTKFKDQNVKLVVTWSIIF